MCKFLTSFTIKCVMDYRELLKRYMQYVKACGGSNFTEYFPQSVYRPAGQGILTPEDMNELATLRDELNSLSPPRSGARRA